eukprot:4625447-Amphidinium_carterae.1
MIRPKQNRNKITSYAVVTAYYNSGDQYLTSFDVKSLSVLGAAVPINSGSGADLLRCPSKCLLKGVVLPMEALDLPMRKPSDNLKAFEEQVAKRCPLVLNRRPDG